MVFVCWHETNRWPKFWLLYFSMQQNFYFSHILTNRFVIPIFSPAYNLVGQIFLKPKKSNSYKWTRFGPNVKGLEPIPAQLVCASRASGLGKFPAHDGPFNVANKRRPRPYPVRLLLADGDSARAASLSPAAAASPSPQVLPSLPAAILPSSAS